MKKFFAEFKKFITRGNVLDMSVGVIVGGAFTAIVNGMSNYILKPIIDWVLTLIFKKDSLSEVYTFLGDPVYKDVLGEDGVSVIGKEYDLANSIYIDWGAFINAIINFILIALVLFIIVRAMNKLKDQNDALKSKKLSKEDKAALKENGIKLSNRKAVKEYLAEKERLEAEAAAIAEAEAAEAERIERENNPTSEELLKRIVAILETKDK